MTVPPPAARYPLPATRSPATRHPLPVVRLDARRHELIETLVSRRRRLRHRRAATHLEPHRLQRHQHRLDVNALLARLGRNRVQRGPELGVSRPIRANPCRQRILGAGSWPPARDGSLATRAHRREPTGVIVRAAEPDVLRLPAIIPASDRMPSATRSASAMIVRYGLISSESGTGSRPRCAATARRARGRTRP